MKVLITCLSWFFAIWLVSGAFISVAQIGKPRKPTSPSIAIASIIVALVVAWLLVGAR